MRCAQRGIARGDRVAILLPQGPAVPVAHVAVYKLGAVALPLAALFGVDAIAYRLRDAGAKALITNAAGVAKLARDRGRARRARRHRLDGRAGRPGRGLRRGAGSGEPRFRACRHLAGRSGDDDLHLRHHRSAEGRAARPPRAARPSARRADAARVPAAARRPALDAGRLGLGRRTPQRAPARPAFRRAGGLAELREVRSRGGLPADGRHEGPQHLRAADRAAHAAHGPEPARAFRARSAHRRLGRRGARRRDLRLGPRGAGADHQRVLRPDRVQPGALLLRGDRRREAGLDRQARARAHASR